MRETCLAFIIMLFLSFPVGANWIVAPDGGIASDGTVNYVFSAECPLHVRGMVYPIPKPYWVPPLSDPAANLGAVDATRYAPIPSEKRP